MIKSIFKRSPVFRIGGDEFAVILQNRDLEDLEELIKKFDEECLNKSVMTDNEAVPVSIAKGFAMCVDAILIRIPALANMTIQIRDWLH